MSFWNIFSAGDTIEKATDAIISTGDMLVLTDEEKLVYNAKATTQFIETLKAYHPFKVTQRILAIWYSFLFGFAFIVGLVITIFNMITTYKQVLANASREMPLKIITISLDPLYALVTAFSLGGIVMIIVGFYFAGGSLESLKNMFNKGK